MKQASGEINSGLKPEFVATQTKAMPLLTRNMTADNDNALKAFVHFSGGSLAHSQSNQIVKNRRRNLLL